MEESVSGFKITGSWYEVVIHGDQITTALRDVGVKNEDALSEWEDWRPKINEYIDEEVSEKTAEKASMAEGKGEQKGRSANNDMIESGKRVEESYKNMADMEASEAMTKWAESLKYVSRSADTAGRKLFRSFEEAIYRRVMTKISPYYFDNELVSANLTSLREDNEYVFEVNVNNDTVKEQVSDRLQRYEDEVNHWRVQPEENPETENVEAIRETETDI